MHPQLSLFWESDQYLADQTDGGAPRWQDWAVLGEMIFSHRVVSYTALDFYDTAHTHDFCEMVVYLGGGVEYLAEHNLYAPRFGDIFFAAPGEFHGARLISPSIYNRYVLWFPPDLLEGYAGGAEALAPFTAERNPERRNLLRPDAREVPGLMALLREAEAAINVSNGGNELLTWSALLRFFHRFGQLWVGSTPAAIAPVSLSPVLEIALSYITSDYVAIQRVSSVADYVHVSCEHLSRLFTQQFGISISEYIRRYRLNESKRLLLEGASVTDACYGVGFTNVSHFIRCFRAYVGVTPAKYRALGRNEEHA